MMATGATGAHEKERTSDWTQPEENSSSIKADDVGTADCSSPWRRRQKSTMKTGTTRTTRFNNLKLLHLICHDHVHGNISTARCTHDKSDITEEPCAGKLASTVLETSRE